MNNITSEVRRGIRIEYANTSAELLKHAYAWDQLTLESKQKLPMLSYAWISSYLENMLKPYEAWWCLFAYQGKELVGVLPVIAETKSVLGIRNTLLRTPHDTGAGDMLIKTGTEDGVVPALLSALDHKVPYRLYTELIRVKEESPSLIFLDNKRHLVVKQPNGYGSIIRIKGRIDDFNARLSSNFTGNLRKAKNKLGTLKNVEMKFLTGGNGADENLKRFMEIEASGWKGKEGTAIMQDPQAVKYYSVLVRRLAARGWLEWHFLNIDGKPIAAQFAVRLGRHLAMYKISYDETFSKYAPGNILFLRTVERAYTLGDTDEINCITDMPWHQNWHMEKDSYYSILIYSCKPSSFFFGFIPKKTRNFAKRLPGLRPVVINLRQFLKGNE